MKLSKAQIETLKDVERGGDLGSAYVPFYPPIKKLLALGLVVKVPSRGISDRYAATEAGLATLKQLAGE